MGRLRTVCKDPQMDIFLATLPNHLLLCQFANTVPLSNLPGYQSAIAILPNCHPHFNCHSSCQFAISIYLCFYHCHSLKLFTAWKDRISSIYSPVKEPAVSVCELDCELERWFNLPPCSFEAAQHLWSFSPVTTRSCRWLRNHHRRKALIPKRLQSRCQEKLLALEPTKISRVS